MLDCFRLSSFSRIVVVKNNSKLVTIMLAIENLFLKKRKCCAETRL